MTATTPFTKVVNGTADASGWDVIVSPIVCRSVLIRNKSDEFLLYRTTDTDPTTQDSIPPGGIWEYNQFGPHWMHQTIKVGDVILFLQAAAGNIDYTVRYF